jgi:N-acetyl-1-D-myo-inositol-2-amino-2-deoxy-alpha-D-glucopyranoside deacetylase
MVERVLFVHAAAGDETATTGAAIARLTSSGSEVSVLTCIRDGETVAELDAALAVLGVTDHRYLGAADARWRGLDPREYSHSGTTGLLAADLGEVASDVGAVILAVEPTVVVSYPSSAPDAERRRVHEATAWATEVLRAPFYAIGRPGAPAQVRVDDADSLARKHSALAVYRGHLALADRNAAEGFSRIRPGQDTFARTSILSRIVSSVLVLALGVFTGALLTAVHQSTIAVGETPVPWGLIVALVITAALLAGLRIVYETRIIAGIATVGLLGAQAFLAFASPGGSILVPDNVSGAVWTIGSVLIAAVVLAWPKIARRSGDRMKSPAAKGPESP